MHERIPDLKSPPTLDDREHSRLRLFDCITTFLKRASQRQPLVLFFDNLHWADRSSLLLLEFFADEVEDARIVVLGTYRDTEVSRGHPLYQTLGELAKLRQFQRLSLGGLTEGDIADYIQLVCAVSPDRSLVREIHSRTAGNPLFVVEVVRLLEQRGVLGTESTTGALDRDVEIPPGVREAISRRLDRLSQNCNRVLTIASFVGRQFGLAELERLVGDLTGEGVLDALDEALAAGIIEELPEALDRFEFAHVLI